MTAAGELANELPKANSGGVPTPAIRRRWEAADTVIALASTLVFIIFAVFGFLCWQGYGSVIDGARTKAEAAANIVALQGSDMVRASITALQLVEARLATEPAALAPEAKAELDRALATLPWGVTLGLYDMQGAVTPNGGTPALPADISGTAYFAAIAQGGDWTIGPQDKDATSGAATIVLAKRLGGEIFSGVAVVSIPGSVLSSFWAPLSLGPGSTVSLIRSDGWVIARHPPLDGPMNLADQPAMANLQAAETGSYVSERSPVDGLARVIGFKHVPELAIIAQASVSLDATLAGLWSSIITVLWLLVPIALALLGGSFLTARLLRQSGRTQRTLAAAVAHNEVLFREIHHRVKNNLQSVASLLQMQPIPREVKTNMGQRIAAMSAVHEHIYRSNNFATVDVKGYLQTLIESIRAGHEPGVRVIEQLEDLSVDKDAATPLGLIVNEVVANAFKHAFPDGREGIVTVTMMRDTEERGQLTVEDNGIGFDPALPAKGIGRRLIAALTQQLKGESRFETAPGGGSLFTLTFPLASAGTVP